MPTIKLNQAQIMHMLQLYKKNEILWNPKNPDFKNAEEKAKKWEEIADEFFCSADDVRKKIKSLRASYYLERNKMEEGSLTQPSLFFYYEFDHIRDRLVSIFKNQEDPKISDPAGLPAQTKGQNSIKNLVDPKSVKPGVAPETKGLKLEKNTADSKTDKNRKEASVVQRIYVNPSVLNNKSNSQPVKNSSHGALLAPNSDKPNIKGNLEPRLSKSDPSFVSNSSNIVDSIRDDEYSMFMLIGKVWADKLAYLHNTQRILGEKIINDIIFQAETGSLTYELMQKLSSIYLQSPKGPIFKN